MAKAPMSEEHKASLRAANADRKASRRQQIESAFTLPSQGKTWRIFECDSRNVMLTNVALESLLDEEDGQEDGDGENGSVRLYYPTFDEAVLALFHREVNANIKRDTETMAFAIAEVERRILVALAKMKEAK